MFRTRLRNIRYEYFGYDCAMCIYKEATQSLQSQYLIFCSELSRTLLDREHKLLYEVSGSHGKRPIDWVIKMGDTIISVTGKENDNNATMITRRKDRLYLTTAEVKGRIYFE
ncbi:uncharacterized protein OCT59_023721 [Rhizophagus irregularis]|uniref:uncharacterized protein n=1 Tax=Rhizophagus irregularis TaxID=588596 RepID=UPI003331A1F4|nr:hypothetical protein OCT59_023721 [Rhizophagus irregularis]